METLFSEVLTKDEWLRMYDNVFSSHPCFLLMLAAAYCTCSRTALLHCNEHDDFKASHSVLTANRSFCEAVVERKNTGVNGSNRLLKFHRGTG